jgi:hypothetical protein
MLDHFLEMALLVFFAFAPDEGGMRVLSVRSR